MHFRLFFLATLLSYLSADVTAAQASADTTRLRQHHLNYWQFGYSAVLVTDTAFYRNKYYHKTTDTLDRLDLHRLGQAVDEVLVALLRA